MLSIDSPTISAVIVSYNTRQMTLGCLRALFSATRDVSLEVAVVDNASSDGSVAAIADQFPTVRVTANDRNLGFGAANNQAMQTARGKYLLLLNSDAFVEPGAVAAMASYLDGHPNVALVGPRLVNRDGSLQVSCFPFPSPLRCWVENLWISKALPNQPLVGDYRGWPHDRERDVAWVIGACLLVRREAYEQVGGFDERFFMYSEEADWQRRMRDAGWKIAFTPAARVMHLGGVSGAAEKPKINRHFFNSLDYYEFKHHGLTGLVLLRAAMTVGSALRIPLWALVHAFFPGRREVARAKVRLLSWLLVRQLTHWRLSP